MSENENGFEILGLEHNDGKYYVGDNLTIHCYASKYKYNNISWKVRNEDCKRRKRSLESSPQNDQFDRAPLIKICDVESITEDTEHSLVETITLVNIDASDSGYYSCSAGKYQDDHGNKLEDVKQRGLVVHPIIAPKIITSNMNGSSASVKVDKMMV